MLNTALCTCPSLPKKCYSLSCILSLPDSSVHGILQARILEWGAIPFSGGSSWPRDWTRVSYILGRFFTVLATRVSIPKSLTIPPTLSFPLATISLFSKSLSLFLFHKFICIIFFLDIYIRDAMWFFSFSDLLHSVWWSLGILIYNKQLLKRIRGNVCLDLLYIKDFPGGSDCKASVYNVGDLGSSPGFEPWVGKIPWRRKWQSTPALLPGKSHGQRSLIGYSLWGHKELDTTEQLHFHCI